MTRSTSEATIEAEAHDIWTYAVDIRRHPEWMNATDPRQETGDGRMIGSRARELLTLGPFHWDIAFEVVASEPARRITWRTVDDRRFVIEVGLELEPAEPGRTHARYTSDIRLLGRWRTLTPLMSLEGPAGVRRELGLLKSRMEAPATAASAA